ncbi:MAG: Maf family protein [Acholeplasmatales bacterium]|nr:Maf family protein [Acholeplasmatales bacterium]
MSVKSKKIILKSSSPRRKELLANMGYEFEIKAYDVDESFDKSLTIVDNVKRLGFLKASVNKDLDYGSILIGCDTIVVLDNKIFGKPKDKEDAFNMLRALSGKTHMVMSGLCVIYKNYVFNDCEISYVKFKELSDDEINEYIDTEEPFGKAGAYAIQGLGFNLVDEYRGSLNNIIGLPTEMLGKVLGEINGMED